MIESLAGSTFEEIREDFMESLCNYYHIEKYSDEYEIVDMLTVSFTCTSILSISSTTLMLTGPTWISAITIPKRS